MRDTEWFSLFREQGVEWAVVGEADVYTFKRARERTAFIKRVSGEFGMCDFEEGEDYAVAKTPRYVGSLVNKHGSPYAVAIRYTAYHGWLDMTVGDMAVESRD